MGDPVLSHVIIALVRHERLDVDVLVILERVIHPLLVGLHPWHGVVDDVAIVLYPIGVQGMMVTKFQV